MNHFDISGRIAKGGFEPHSYLSNVCLSHFQDGKGFVSGKMFPIVPVGLSTSYFYGFHKGDLLRDYVAEKPRMGTVAPAQFGHTKHQYLCNVDQVITGIDQISSLDYQRAGAPYLMDPRKGKAEFIAQQLMLHQDILWAKEYFQENVWGNSYTGVDSAPESGEFYQFDHENSDPVEFIHRLGTEMTLSGLRRPNKMCMGANVFAKLRSNPCILERVKYQGSSSNPASVTLNVLAQLFGLDEVLVSEAVYNRASLGQADDFAFVCAPDDVLLVYAPSQPSLMEPSAGYSFVWDMLGNGQYTPILSYQGAGGEHMEYMEGLMAVDHQVTCGDLGVYLSSAVSALV